MRVGGRSLKEDELGNTLHNEGNTLRKEGNTPRGITFREQMIE